MSLALQHHRFLCLEYFHSCFGCEVQVTIYKVLSIVDNLWWELWKRTLASWTILTVKAEEGAISLPLHKKFRFSHKFCTIVGIASLLVAHHRLCHNKHTIQIVSAERFNKKLWNHQSMRPKDNLWGSWFPNVMPLLLCLLLSGLGNYISQASMSPICKRYNWEIPNDHWQKWNFFPFKSFPH